MYDLLGKLIDTIEQVPSEASDDVCTQVEAAIEGAGLVPHDYMAMIDAQGVARAGIELKDSLVRQGSDSLVSVLSRVALNAYGQGVRDASTGVRDASTGVLSAKAQQAITHDTAAKLSLKEPSVPC